MRYGAVICAVVLLLGFAGCNDEPDVDAVTASLVDALNDELAPLGESPTVWGDDELKPLSAYDNVKILGLGEATHGTSEFFKAKHRIFQYMVQNYGYKIFAIEADVGESILINEAVVAGDKSKITDLMKTKMHFWTWKTNEVRDLIFWMCDYNNGKPEADKVQYWGVDCQYNTFHPGMVMDRLAGVNVSFLPFAESVMNEAKSEATKRFASYSDQQFLAYAVKLNNLIDSVKAYQDYIVSKSSQENYELTLHLVDVVRQTAEVMYYTPRSSTNYRDKYMADNAAWVHEYLSNAKVVLWAHNHHISDNQQAATMGYHLVDKFHNDYASVGFLFSKGSFRAVTYTNNQAQGLSLQKLDSDPLKGSINAVMARAESPVFIVNVTRLQRHDQWKSAFGKGMKYFQMGAVYDGFPADYYSWFDPLFFNDVIFFSNTTEAIAIQ
jgi:erythromycin esterase